MATSTRRGTAARNAGLVGAVLVLLFCARLCGAVALDGACCLANGGCEEALAFDCEEAGGDFIGEGITCAQARCGVSVAAPVLSLGGLAAAAGTLLGIGIYRRLSARIS